MTSAKQRVRKLMRGYDPEDWDADSIAEKIAASHSMRKVLTRNQRRLFVLGLFDGPTSEREEDAAMKILRAARLADLKWVIGKVGWKKLENELDNKDIAWLRGTTGSLSGFNYRSSRADDIAELIAKRKSWLANFSVSDKVKLVRALFDGPTGEKQEDAAMTILKSMSDGALKRAVKALGWSNLWSELDNGDIVVLLERTLDFSAFDPTNDRSDEIARALSRKPAFRKRLSRSARKKLVLALFDGNTGEEEEDAAVRILLSEPTGAGLIKLIREVGGWDELISELDDGDFDKITKTIMSHLDHDTAELRSDMPWLYERGLDLFVSTTQPSVEDIVKAKTRAQAEDLLDNALERRKEILQQITLLGIRGKTLFPTLQLIHTLEWLNAKIGSRWPKEKKGDVTKLKWEVKYTDLVVKNLEEGDYGALLRELPSIIDPSHPVRRIALYEVCERLRDVFDACDAFVKAFGTTRQKNALDRFNNAKDAFLGIDPSAPLGGSISDVAKVLGLSASAGFTELVDAVASLADGIGKISVRLLVIDSSSDDRSRDFINREDARTLDWLPTDHKIKLIRWCLDGFTYDEDEDAILTVLRASKRRCKAEFYQIVRSVRLSSLNSNLDGDQNGELRALLKS